MPDGGRSLIEVTRLTTTGISVLTDAAPCLPPSSLIECRLTRGWHRRLLYVRACCHIQTTSNTNSQPASFTACSTSSRNLPNSSRPPPPTLLSTRVAFTRVPYCEVV